MNTDELCNYIEENYEVNKNEWNNRWNKR
jgi:hypothetical protein